jgi:DDE superfamily endonuclease/Archaeal putative transposase ISC1217
MFEPAVPARLLALLTPFAGVFSRPGFENFQALVVGWILCPGRHTISRVIQASAGMTQPKHHTAYYRFFSRAVWSVDALGKVLFDLLLPFAGPEVVLLVDDTLCHRSGPHLFGAAMHHDALRSTYLRGAAGARTVAFAFGHNWVVLAIAVTPPWNSERRIAIPILFRLYRSKKRTPSAQYRKRTELATEMIHLILKILPDNRSVHVVGDAEYACKTLVRALPLQVHFTGPMTMDAALYAETQPYSGMGRPRVKGERMDSPAKLVQRRSTPWRTLTAHIYGRKISIQVKTCDALWYTVAGTRLVRVILTRDPTGRLRDRAYFSTDTGRCVEDILRVFSFRWEIEVAFRNTKQTLGLQDAQNGWWRRLAHEPRAKQKAGPNPKNKLGMHAIEHTLPIGFLAYALVLLWYFHYGKPKEDVARARSEAPWYTQKIEPSFADMLVAIRHSIWKQRLTAHPSRKRLPEKVEDFLPGWVLAA